MGGNRQKFLTKILRSFKLRDTVIAKNNLTSSSSRYNKALVPYNARKKCVVGIVNTDLGTVFTTLQFSS